jgi:hypothetical protein
MARLEIDVPHDVLDRLTIRAVRLRYASVEDFVVALLTAMAAEEGGTPPHLHSGQTFTGES